MGSLITSFQRQGHELVLCPARVAVNVVKQTAGLDVSVISQQFFIYLDLNSTEDRRLCRSLCSLFWACSLFCWEILFQEPNGIWHLKPIFSSSHLAVGSVGSTTANDNTSFHDKLFLIFIISSLLKYLSIFFSFLKRTSSELGSGH